MFLYKIKFWSNILILLFFDFAKRNPCHLALNKRYCRYIILGVVEMFLATVGDVPWDWGIDNNLFSILFCWSNSIYIYVIFTYITFKKYLFWNMFFKKNISFYLRYFYQKKEFLICLFFTKICKGCLSRWWWSMINVDFRWLFFQFSISIQRC